MNVLFIFYIPSGGMETLNRERSAALRREGVDCHLLYMQPGAGLCNSAGLPVTVTNDDREIGALLAGRRFDAIVVTSHYLMLPRLRNLGYAGPLIYEAQGLGNPQTARQILSGAFPVLSRYCDAVLYPKTPHLAELFLELYPGLPHFSFHNCIDAERFAYRPLPRESSPVIGWVGRIEANKNWPLFLEIGYWLIRHDPSIRLWMFADDTLSAQPDEFERVVYQLALSDHLVRYSNIPHGRMAEYYSRIGDSGGLLCSTSVTEGFGYAVAEAMCCQCPVLATDSDGVRSMIIHNVTGKFFVDAADAVSQAQAWMRDHHARETVRINARRHILTHFSPETYALHFRAMLTALGAGSPP